MSCDTRIAVCTGAKMFILNKYKLFTGFSVTKLYFLINMLNNKIVPCLNQCRISDYLREKKINLRPHRLRLRPNYMRFQSIVSRISRLIVITPSETISFGKANKSKKVRWHVQSLLRGPLDQSLTSINHLKVLLLLPSRSDSWPSLAGVKQDLSPQKPLIHRDKKRQCGIKYFCISLFFFSNNQTFWQTM